MTRAFRVFVVLGLANTGSALIAQGQRTISTVHAEVGGISGKIGLGYDFVLHTPSFFHFSIGVATPPVPPRENLSTYLPLRASFLIGDGKSKVELGAFAFPFFYMNNYRYFGYEPYGQVFPVIGYRYQQAQGLFARVAIHPVTYSTLDFSFLRGRDAPSNFCYCLPYMGVSIGYSFSHAATEAKGYHWYTSTGASVGIPFFETQNGPKQGGPGGSVHYAAEDVRAGPIYLLTVQKKRSTGSGFELAMGLQIGHTRAEYVRIIVTNQAGSTVTDTYDHSVRSTFIGIPLTVEKRFLSRSFIGAGPNLDIELKGFDTHGRGFLLGAGLNAFVGLGLSVSERTELALIANYRRGLLVRSVFPVFRQHSFTVGLQLDIKDS